MKALRDMNNVEKAKLLFDLFPDEMPQCIAVMQQVTQDVLQKPEALRSNWEGQFITVEFWEKLAGNTGDIIKKYGNRLSKNNKLFADQLFDGYQALFSVHCLQQYKKICANQALTKAIDVFFNYH